MRWFRALPLHRKMLLFLAGGMMTLVFDAFVAHFSWNARTLRWTQAVPVVYGLLAFLALGTAALVPLRRAHADRIPGIVGVLGIVVGGTGMVLHGLTLFESLEGEALSFWALGKAVSLAPPLFAPAAFAGVGLLLVVLPRIAPLPEREGSEALRHRLTAP